MSIRTWHPGLGLYLVVAVAGLLLYLPNSENAEAAALLVIAMVVITLPLGLLVALILGLGSWALEQMGFGESLGVTGQVLIWVLLFGVGFVQWRYLAPWAIRKLQTNSQS
jgi:hypothetical protein